jgi:hypothetical protein
MVPQVVVRIDDRQIGLEDRLLVQGEPVGPDGEVGVRRGAAGHAALRDDAASLHPAALRRQGRGR